MLPEVTRLSTMPDLSPHATGLKMGRRRVYVAGPYSIGDTMTNVKNACAAMDMLISAKFIVFNPLLTHFQHTLYPQPYEVWLEQDMEWLRLCHLFLRLPGESHGAELEEAEAKSLGIPVYYDIRDLMMYESPLW